MFPHRNKLEKMGLEEKSPGYFYADFEKIRKIKKIKKFALRQGLTFRYDNEYGKRNDTYRKTYFNNNPPIKGKYRCVYCGRRFKKNQVQVDHLYPIAKVSKSYKLQQKLKKQGINSVNDINNLVCACRSCNLKKYTNMGLWIVRGKLGKKEWLWKVRIALRWIIVIAATCFVAFLIWKEPIMNVLNNIFQKL